MAIQAVYLADRDLAEQDSVDCLRDRELPLWMVVHTQTATTAWSQTLEGTHMVVQTQMISSIRARP